MSARRYWVYILASNSRRLYVGVTNNLRRRLVEHREGHSRGFTSRYAIVQLVYFEQTSNVAAAIAREKQIKGWSRRKKLALIATQNPEFSDRSAEVLAGP